MLDILVVSVSIPERNSTWDFWKVKQPGVYVLLVLCVTSDSVPQISHESGEPSSVAETAAQLSTPEGLLECRSENDANRSALCTLSRCRVPHVGCRLGPVLREQPCSARCSALPAPGSPSASVPIAVSAAVSSSSAFLACSSCCFLALPDARCPSCVGDGARNRRGDADGGWRHFRTCHLLLS